MGRYVSSTKSGYEPTLPVASGSKTCLCNKDICIYCPEEYFAFNDDPHIGCYTAINFAIKQEPSSGLTPPVFSPRDVNGQFDKLLFETENTFDLDSANYIKWDMRVEAETGPLVGDVNYDGGANLKNQQGIQSLGFDGWITNQACLIDGKYKLKFLPKSEKPSGKPDFYLIKVPDYDDPVEARLFINPYYVGTTLYERNVLPFWVDNTPPFVSNVNITERQTVLATSAPEYETEVSFNVVEPQVYETSSGFIRDSLKVYVDDTPFYTPPSLSNGFGIATQLDPNLITVTQQDLRHVQVSFKPPYRLPGHKLEVDLQDVLANHSRYTLYPTGGTF